jgi:hypothetical protein
MTMGEEVFTGFNSKGEPVWTEFPPGVSGPESYRSQPLDVQGSREGLAEEWLDAWNRDVGIEKVNDYHRFSTGSE